MNLIGEEGEFEQNYIYRIDRVTGQRESLAKIDGPVYYSYTSNRNLFFGVTAELCPSQTGRSASLWHVDSHDNVKNIFSINKDPYPVTYFLPGAFHFSNGPGLNNQFFLHCIALQYADNQTYVVQQN